MLPGVVGQVQPGWDKNVKIARPPTKHAMPTASGQILTEISGLLDVRLISGNHARSKWVDRSSFSVEQGPRQEVCLFVRGNELSFAVFELLLAWTGL